VSNINENKMRRKIVKMTIKSIFKFYRFDRITNAWQKTEFRS